MEDRSPPRPEGLSGALDQLHRHRRGAATMSRMLLPIGIQTLREMRERDLRSFG